MRQLSATELAAWLADAQREKPLLLDVREPWEWQAARIEGSQHIPMRELPGRVAEIERGREVVAICHHGGRSMQAAMFLDKQGFASVRNLAGGVDAWARQVDPAMATY